MKKIKTEKQKSRYSPYAVLAAIGMKLKAMNLFGIIFQTVNIAQKTVKHKPAEKLKTKLTNELARFYALKRSIL